MEHRSGLRPRLSCSRPSGSGNLRSKQLVVTAAATKETHCGRGARRVRAASDTPRLRVPSRQGADTKLPVKNPAPNSATTGPALRPQGSRLLGTLSLLGALRLPGQTQTGASGAQGRSSQPFSMVSARGRSSLPFSVVSTGGRSSPRRSRRDAVPASLGCGRARWRLAGRAVGDGVLAQSAHLSRGPGRVGRRGLRALRPRDPGRGAGSGDDEGGSDRNTEWAGWAGGEACRAWGRNCEPLSRRRWQDRTFGAAKRRPGPSS